MTTSSVSRRQRYQSQLSNAASSLGQSFSNSELINFNDSYASTFPSLTPWVNVVFSPSLAVTTKGTDDEIVLANNSNKKRERERMKQQVCEQ